MLKKTILIIVLLVGIAAAFVAYQKYGQFYNANVPSSLTNNHLHIPTGSTYENLVNILKNEGFLIDLKSFQETAEWMSFADGKIRAGRFKIEPSWSNKRLIRHLQIGEQATVRVVLNNERLLEEVAAKVARFVEPDSLAFIQVFHDEAFLEKIGYTRETLMSLFIPNSYDYYWTTTPRDFVERMTKEHQRFWEKDNRKTKAEAQNLNPKEVYTLASIIEKETNQNAEKPRMAGVYLNRLKKGMLLQADPTCVFATRDFTARRVLNKHLEFDSPYNTYMYAGLPPGPIAMASIASIDAVLNPEDHDYLFFVARADGSGMHSFAKTLRGHNQNIAVYRRNLRASKRR